MHGPDGRDDPNQSEFLEIVPSSMIRIRHVSLPHYEPSIALEPTAAGTLVAWLRVFENADFARNARAFLETANEQNLDHLAREVGSDSRSRPKTAPGYAGTERLQ